MATAPDMPGNAPAQPKSDPDQPAALIPKRGLPRQQVPEYIQTLIGHPSSAERQALRAIVSSADIVHVDGEWGLMRFLVVPIDDVTIDALAAFEAEAAEIQEDNEDGCGAYDDHATDGMHYVPNGTDHEAGTPEDAEDDSQGFGNVMTGWAMRGKVFPEKTADYLPGDPMPENPMGNFEVRHAKGNRREGRRHD